MQGTMKNIFLTSMLAIFLLIGCNPTDNMESFFSFPEGQWQRFENPIIEIDVTKPGIFYDMYLEINYDPEIAKEPIPITVIMSTPSGEIRSRNIRIVPGTAEGKIRVILRKDFAFSEQGICSFEIENRSQNIETSGLKNLGIVMERR